MRRGIRQFIPLIFIVIIVILIIAAAVSIGRMLTGGSKTTTPIDNSRSELLNTSEGHSVVMTARGAIVGDDNFRTYKIIVGPDTRQFLRTKGYEAQPLENDAYDNNVQGYTQFVYALDKTGFENATALEGSADDSRGVCAQGVLYEFDIMDNGDSVKHLWTSTCGGNQRGSLKANLQQLIALFQAQVPDSIQYIGSN